jgi:hypothetical protein
LQPGSRAAKAVQTLIKARAMAALLPIFIFLAAIIAVNLYEFGRVD